MEDIWAKIGAFFTQAVGDRALSVLSAILMLLAGFVLIRWLIRLFDRYIEKSKIDKGITSFLSSLLNILLKFVLVISVAAYLGVPSTSFIAILSSVGLAIGLALQGSLGNFAGGLMLLWFHPFRVGDYIKTPDAEGTVAGMNIMYTQLSTFDGKLVVVPNSKLSNGVLTNFSAYPRRRVDIAFTVSGEAKVDAVRGLMERAAAAHPMVHDAPAPEARLGAFDGGRPVYTLRCWCDTANFWTVTFDLTERLKAAFEDAGIDVPPPGTQVQLRQSG